MKVNKMISYFKNYKWNSLFFKYFRVIFSIILISVLIVYMIILFFINETYIKNQSADITNNTNRISYQLDSLLSHISSAHQLIHSDSTVLYYLLTNDNITTAQPHTINHIKNTLSSYTYSQGQHISSVYLYSNKNNYVFSTKHSSSHLDEFFDLTWYEHINNPDRNTNIVFSPSPHAIVSNSLSVIYPLYSSDIQIGVLVFNIDIDSFFRDLINADGNAIIYDTEKNIIYSYNDLYTSALKNAKHSSLNSSEFVISNSNISLCIVQPYENMFGNYSIVFILIITFLLCVAVSFALSVYISSILYNSIAQIAANVQFILEGHTPMPDEYDEITAINKNILQIVTKSNSIETELSKKIVELNKTSVQAMQLQINPHFLFNTLNTMNVIAMTKCTDNTLSEMIILLSDILGNIMDSTNTLVSIHSELVYTKKYVDILLIREMNSFEVEWDIPEQLSGYRVPKFCIQPLVENSFEHGIKQLGANEKKVIKIKLSETKKDIKIEVSNTGPLIAPNKLSELNKQLSDAIIPHKKHIGLKNTNLRIKLIFGEEYGCHIRNTDCGVISSIVIQKIYDNLF